MTSLGRPRINRGNQRNLGIPSAARLTLLYGLFPSALASFSSACRFIAFA
jgi:hypothetical protein